MMRYDADASIGGARFAQSLLAATFVILQPS
jgi:hypothetical protein